MKGEYTREKSRVRDGEKTRSMERRRDEKRGEEKKREWIQIRQRGVRVFVCVCALWNLSRNMDTAIVKFRIVQVNTLLSMGGLRL